MTMKPLPFRVLPYLSKGILSMQGDDINALLHFYWRVLHKLQVLMEDLEGSDQREHYIIALKISLLERLYENEEILAQRASVRDVHTLALALELGMPNMVDTGGLELMQFLFEGDAGDYANAMQLGNEIVAAIPGTLFKPFESAGQGLTLKMLRDWTRLAEVFETDIDFLRAEFKEM